MGAMSMLRINLGERNRKHALEDVVCLVGFDGGGVVFVLVRVLCIVLLLTWHGYITSPGCAASARIQFTIKCCTMRLMFGLHRNCAHDLYLKNIHTTMCQQKYRECFVGNVTFS